MAFTRRVAAPLVAALFAGAFGVLNACYSGSDSDAPNARPVKPADADAGFELDGAAVLPTYPGTSPASDSHTRLCPTARSADGIPARASAVAASPHATFDDVAANAKALCGGCHITPAANGGFSFQPVFAGGDMLIDGVHKTVPGLGDVAEKMAGAVLSGAMPPNRGLTKDTAVASFATLLKAWVDGGKPNGAFPLPKVVTSADAPSEQLPADVGAQMTAVGNCIPNAEVVGTDRAKDEMFAAATALPDDLAATDVPSLDALPLAQHGTFAYAPAYPLWSDDAKKLRLIHVPAKYDGPVAQRQSVTYDAKTAHFTVPENTRFYKTFFKGVRNLNGELRYRKIETRVIVVRTPWQNSLFGTYKWNDSETSATLATAPYRNGEPFKDEVFTYETDEVAHSTRTYALPARHRCVECHQGGEGQNFVLGFTPLQLHRRPAGVAGVDGAVGDDDITQIERLIGYGVLSGIPSEDSLPALETPLDGKAPRNDRELSAQAYLVGNCAHCHNPNGFATRQDVKLTGFDLSAGHLFQFPVATRGASSGNLLVSAGNPAGSELYKRTSKETELQGSVALQHMPLHTAGLDCHGIDRLGRWIAGIPVSPGGNPSPDAIKKSQDDADAQATAFDSGCTTPKDVSWLDEDFTQPKVYEPRRGDWNDPQSGMTPAARALTLTDDLKTLAATPIATGYWNANDDCSFPNVDAPEGGTRPWMLNRAGKPKRGFGEVFYQSAGSFYFVSTCQKCHGPRANGDSGIAKLLATQTGGTVRVANLMDGLFGDNGKNLQQFEVFENGRRRNLAPNYLVWMAGGATHVAFPPGFSDLVGSYGPNMLNRVRDQFKRLLPDMPDGYAPYYQTYDIYYRVATLGNPITPELGFIPHQVPATPINPVAQAAWLDKAQANAGFVLFEFFLNEASQGKWPLSPNECDKVFKKP